MGNKKVLTLGLIVSSLFVGFLIGNYGDSSKKTEAAKYSFISKRLQVENQNDIIINFVDLRAQLLEYTAPYGKSLGIYFEYLPSGTSIGINDKVAFLGASLLKLPVAMKVYKLIEGGKLSKDQKVTISANHLDKGFGTLWQKGAGATISIEEAIKLSIGQSDNTAFQVLRDLVSPNAVSDTFDYLDIPTDTGDSRGATVTPKNYSSVLRSLYLSAYLSFPNSNELLDIMTTSPFRDRIVAGVPTNIKVAHKVGIYKQVGGENTQLHSDCGIIYASNRPYMLCVMSNGNIEEATKQISEISKLIYDYVTKY